MDAKASMDQQVNMDITNVQERVKKVYNAPVIISTEPLEVLAAGCQDDPPNKAKDVVHGQPGCEIGLS